MTPIQVTVRFPAEAGRQWQFRPVGEPPQAGAILPRPWDVTPDATEAADGSFEVALLATDEASSRWAWQVRDPDRRWRTIAVPSNLAGQVMDYADLPGDDLAGPAPTSGAAPNTAPPSATGSDLEQAPAWILDALRDMARRIAHLEATAGAPEGELPIDPADVDIYLAGFTGDYITDYL